MYMSLKPQKKLNKDIKVPLRYSGTLTRISRLTSYPFPTSIFQKKREKKRIFSVLLL